MRSPPACARWRKPPTPRGALKARTLALWVAQNRLAAAQIATPWPALGDYAGEAAQAGRRSPGRRPSRRRPIPRFAESTSRSPEPQSPDYALARLTGFLGNPSRGDETRARLHADRGAARARHLRRDRGARLSRARPRSPTASPAVRGGAALASARDAVHPSRSRLPPGVPRSARVGAAREPAWLGTRLRAARAHSCSREPAPNSRRARSGGTAHRLPVARRHARARVLAERSITSSRASRSSIRWSPASPGFQLEYLTRTGAWRRPLAAARRGRSAARGALTLTLDDGMRIDRWFALR